MKWVADLFFMLVLYTKLALEGMKRATWCTFFHDWRRVYFGGGYTRDVCTACKNNWRPAPHW